ncbi:MAG TPA: cupin domain-containing protein [Ilumatobacteraceae bacterium]|nr:cupin domain-containing protein [Ilumatobacteraceae bacterium]
MADADVSHLEFDGAQVVLPCADPMGPTLEFFSALGFAVRTIVPADHPTVAVLEGHGLAIRLEVGVDVAPGMLRLLSTNWPIPDPITAPNGTVVEFGRSASTIDIPPLQEELVVSRVHDPGGYHQGRAGMQYRDLIPGRLGGRFIASHILIPDGGPVDDYVHFHQVRFQMIYCHRGWVRVTYEDQGEPMLLTEGDCFLQPSTIRHRVLEASDRMQVVEIGCPAEHETWGDPATTLPTGREVPERGYGADGHRFVFHRASATPWRPWRAPGWAQRDTGIGAATDGMAGARTVRPDGFAPPATFRHHGEFCFLFVLAGGLSAEPEGHSLLRLTEGDCITVPSGLALTLSDATPELRLLDVTMPDVLPVTVE